MRNNLEIIANSFKFTFKNYKYLVLVIIILYSSKLIIDKLYYGASKELLIIIYFINLLILGFAIGLPFSIVSNLIKNDRPIPKITVHHVTSGLKDRILDFYYMFLTLLTSTIILSPIIVHHFNLINELVELSEDFQFNFSNYAISLIHQADFTIFLMTFIFAIIFMTFLALLMIAKIHYEDGGNFREAFNLFLIFRKVKKMGYKEFFKVILSMSGVLFILSFIMNYFQYFIEARLISTIFEAILIFINLRAFTYIYDEANLDEVTDTSININIIK